MKKAVLHADNNMNEILCLQQEQPEFVKDIWHKVSEEANLTRPVVLSDGDKYMSPPCTFPFKDMSGFVKAMNKKYKADYTIWAYMDDLLNTPSLQQEQPKVDLVAELKHHLATTPKEQLEKEWKELEPWGNIKPTVQEFLYGNQPEMDLDKEITHIWGKCVTEPKDQIACLHIESFIEIARHFAGWGATHLKK